MEQLVQQEATFILSDEDYVIASAICLRCKTQKPLFDFYTKNGKPIRTACKICKSALDKEYRQNNREKLKAVRLRKQARKSSLIAAYGRENLITMEQLKATYHYDPETGRFTRLTSAGGAKAGEEAGYINGGGYRILSFGLIKYRAHRLAWFYMTGAWPKEDVDHKNNTPDDNRWENLREATDAQNLQNIGMPKHNTSGLKGASWREDKQKWRASICSRGKWRHLGYFSSKEEAHAAYCAAALELNGEFANFG